MSLPELIPTNLPQFVQNKSRSAFANSMIPSGAVLLFAESDGNGGSKLIAKNPDGSFSEVGCGSKKFYKCASVGTGTWSGYLASADSTTGIWSFAETATTGLTYERITPVVGKVYDEGCTFMVSNYKTGLPEDGLIFYLPLDEEPGSTDVTGKTLNKINPNYTFVTEDGILCAQLGTGCKVTSEELGFTNDTSVRLSFSFWAKCGYANEGVRGGFAKQNGDTFAIGLEVQLATLFARYDNGTRSRRDDIIADGDPMAHYVFTFNGSQYTWYWNGQQIAYYLCTTPFGAYYGDGCTHPALLGSNSAVSYLAAFRIYNRVLDDSEIEALAAEFTPTPAS